MVDCICDNGLMYGPLWINNGHTTEKTNMAKADGKRGGPSREERIKNLRQELGSEGIAAATKLHTQDIDVIRLAFYTHPERNTTGGGLGKRIEDVLSVLPAAEANSMRAQLTAAKAKLTKAKAK